MLKTQKNPIPPFAQASFLKFATRPRDRKWHISKLATLPRAPYQPHAKNNQSDSTGTHLFISPVWQFNMAMEHPNIWDTEIMYKWMIFHCQATLLEGNHRT